MTRSVLRLASLVAVLAGLHSLLWLASSRMLNWQTDTLLANAQAHGWTVSIGQRSPGGWPLAATLTIDRPAVSGGERSVPGGLAWSADRVVARVSLLHPLTLVLSAEGQEFLRISHAPDIGFTAARAEGRLGLWAGSRGWATFMADEVEAGIAGSRHPQDVQVAEVRLSLRQVDDADTSGGQGATSLKVGIRAHGIGLPDVGRWPLGATISDAAMELMVVALPRPTGEQAASAGQSRAAAQAQAWRDSGGRLQLGSLSVRWGPLTVAGSATLGLDERLQPAGSGTFEMSGTDAALDAASDAGLIEPGVALTAKAVLAMMPRGNGGTLRLPIVLHDRTFSLGHIPVSRVADIAW